MRLNSSYDSICSHRRRNEIYIHIGHLISAHKDQNHDLLGLIAHGTEYHYDFVLQR